MSDDLYEFVIRESVVSLVGPDDEGNLSGSTTIDVTSRLGRHDTVMLRVEPGEGASESWFSVDPENQFLQIGNTASTTVSVVVPGGTEPGSYGFVLGAYAETDQQRDFTRSQELSFEVSEPVEAKGGLPVPWWVLALAAGLVLVVGAIAFVATRGGGDDETTTTTVEPVSQTTIPAGAMANLVGLTLAEAETAFGGELTSYGDSAETAGDQCVLLQAPVPGTMDAADTATVLTTTCPTPAPTPALPETLDDECATSFSFCRAVHQYFPEPPINAEWQDAKLAMVATFIDAFTVPGVDTPTVVGLPLVEARAALQTAGLSFTEVQDGGPETGCRDPGTGQLVGQPVLLQHPFPGQKTATTGTVTLLLTACPDQAEVPGDVQIDSLIELTGFSNLEAAAPAFARALSSDPSLGDEYLGSTDMVADLDLMLALFRLGFAVPQVPDVRGAPISQAELLMEKVGLTVVSQQQGERSDEDISGEGRQCTYATTVAQSADPGAFVSTLSVRTVILEWVLEYRRCGLSSTDWAANVERLGLVEATP